MRGRGFRVRIIGIRRVRGNLRRGRIRGFGPIATLENGTKQRCTSDNRGYRGWESVYSMVSFISNIPGHSIVFRAVRKEKRTRGCLVDGLP